MDLLKQLSRKKDTVVKRWFDGLMETYPADTSQFLRNQKDPFANPIGQTSFQSLKDLLDHILDGFDRKTALPLIDPIIRIRAIQNFTPAAAVRFVFDLKAIIRKVAPVDPSDHQSRELLSTLDHRLDELGLLAFDVFVQCREKIYDLKANEMRARTLSAFDRAGLIKEQDTKTS